MEALRESLLRGKVSEASMEASKKSTGWRRYQERQNSLIDELCEVERAVREGSLYQEEEEEEEEAEKKGRTKRSSWWRGWLSEERALGVSFGANVVLLGAKVAAYGLSGSLVVLASAVDSTLDVGSGAALCAVRWWAGGDHRMAYPAGVERVEAAGVLAFSVAMGLAAFQVVVEAARALASGGADPKVSSIVLGLLATTVGVKGLLWAYCGAAGRHSPAVDAYRADHRNDAFGNAFGLAALLIAAKAPFPMAWAVDPLAAMVVGLILISTWYAAGVEQIQTLVGRSADAGFLARIAYLALVWDPDLILAVDTVRAYRASATGFLCELDIVLPAHLPLKRAHDLGQALQDHLEAFPDVHRAFVHLDWETSHNLEHSGLPSLPKVAPTVNLSRLS